jgi:hypothetical protein
MDSENLPIVLMKATISLRSSDVASRFSFSLSVQLALLTLYTVQNGGDIMKDSLKVPLKRLVIRGGTLLEQDRFIKGSKHVLT